jgi:hypothetical protein
MARKHMGQGATTEIAERGTTQSLSVVPSGALTTYDLASSPPGRTKAPVAPCVDKTGD